MEKKRWFGLVQKGYGIVHIEYFEEQPTVEVYLQSVGEPYSCEFEDFSLIEVFLEQRDEKLAPAIAEMEKCVQCLALELPEPVHNDVRRIWDNLKSIIAETETGKQL